MLAPAIIGKIGIKRAIVLAATLMSMFSFSLIVTAWRGTIDPETAKMPHSSTWHFFYSTTTCKVILVIGNVMTGVGQGLLWVAQGEYISLCATESTKGFYYALYWAFYMLSNIVGNVAGGIIMTKSSGPSFFIIMGSLMLLVAFG